MPAYYVSIAPRENMNKEFEVHLLNEEGKLKAVGIANAFNDCLERLKTLCPENTREFSIVKTKLEEACFFAKKSMAMVADNTVPPGPPAPPLPPGHNPVA